MMSTIGDNIEKLVKSAFENNLEGFDSNSWDAMNQRLDEEILIEEEIKNCFSANEELNSEVAWSDMQDRLDVDEVWDRIAERKRPLIAIWFVAASILVAILGTAIFIGKEKEPNDEFALRKLETSSATQQTDISSTLFIQNKLAEKTVSSVLDLAASTRQKSGKDLVLKVHVNPDQNLRLEEGTSNASPLYEMQLVNIDKYFQDLKSYPALDVQENDVKTPFFGKASNKLKFSAGIIGEVGSSVFYGDQYKEGLRGSSLIQNQFSQGTSYGVFGYLRIHPQWEIELSYFFRSDRIDSKQVYYRSEWTEKQQSMSFNRFAAEMSYRKTYSPKLYTRIGSGFALNVQKFNETYIGNKLNSYSASQNSYFSVVGSVSAGYQWSFLFLEAGIQSDIGLTQFKSEKSTFRILNGGIFLKSGINF